MNSPFGTTYYKSPSTIDPGISAYANLFFITNISVFFSKNGFLKIRFDTHNYNYSLYKVEVFENSEYEICPDLDENALFLQNIPGQTPITEVNVNRSFSNGEYCIRVTPLKLLDGGSCKSGCRMQWKVIKTSNLTEFPDCKNWMAGVQLEPILSLGNLSMKVGVNINTTFDLCFQLMTIDLWTNAYIQCDTTSGNKFESANVSLVPGRMITNVFNDVPAGNYCVRIKGYDSGCSCWGTHLFSQVQTLYPLLPEFPRIISPPHQNPVWPLVFIVPFVLGLTVLFILWKLNKLRCHRNPPNPGPEPDPPPTIDQLIAIAEERAKKLEVVLLYSRDFPEHQEVVSAFEEFLLEFWGLGAVRFIHAEEDVIAYDVNAWVESITTRKENRRFVIVESEGAVLQEEHRKILKILLPRDEDYLDAIFPYALQLLKTDTNALCGYPTIFVVRFDYSPSNLRLKSFVPHRRYQLPMTHLLELYWDLLHLQDVMFLQQIKVELVDKLERKWDEYLRYVLIPCVDSARQTLENNPNLVSETFEERDLFQTEA